MLPSSMIIREYISNNGTSPFSKWFNKLNSQAAAKVAVALFRMEAGNLSNIKWLKGIGVQVTGFIWLKMEINLSF